MNFMFVSNSGRRACGAVGLQGRLLGPLRREEGGVVGGGEGGGGGGGEELRTSGLELKMQIHPKTIRGLCLAKNVFLCIKKTKTLIKSNEFSLKFSFHVYI